MTLTLEIVKSRVTYHPESGIWTDVKTGQPVGHIAYTKPGKRKPYIRISLGRYGCKYSHRLAVFWMTGEWPPCKVDHRNQNGLDNSWENLRPADDRQNQWNLTVPANHPTGYRGVRFDRLNNGYVTELRAEGVRIFKRFRGADRFAFEAAVAFRLEAERLYHRW